MKDFIMTLKQMYEERYTAMFRKVIQEKIPAACFDFEEPHGFAEFLREKGINIASVIVKSVSGNETHTQEVIALHEVAHNAEKFGCIFVREKMEAAFMRIPELKKIPVIVMSHDEGRTEAIYDMYMKNLDELLEVYRMLQDEISRKTFLGFIRAKVSRNLNTAFFAETPLYICEGFMPDEGAVIIDGGACDGSTSAKFSGMGYRVFAFELDGENCKLAKKLSEEKNFCVENLGLGAFRHTAKYTHDPCKIFITKEKEAGISSADIVDLDYYVREKHLQSVDFIKLDVEGAEVDAIKGAAAVIARFKPILAVSVYHKIEHLWTIPKLIKSIRSDYEFCLRHFVTSADDAPALFNEELLKDLYSVTGSAGFISFGECVLFAR